MNISKLMTFIFRNRTIFWDIPKWNRGQTKWDGGSTILHPFSLPYHFISPLLLQSFSLPYLFIFPLPSTLISFFLFPFIFLYFCLFLFTLFYYKFVTISSILCIVFSHKKKLFSLSLFLNFLVDFFLLFFLHLYFKLIIFYIL